MRANRSIRVLRCSFSSGALGALLAVVISLAVSAPVLAETRRAYVWADQPTAADYAPNPLYVQPGGGEVRIVRSAVGRYTVRLGSILDQGGNVQVSSYGSDATSCQVVSWSTAGANVACFGANGAPADSQFSLLAVHAEGAGSVSYTWAGQPNTASYAPSPIYTYAPGGTARIDRTGVGMYAVALSSAIVGSGANLHVTAYGSTPRRCSIISWGGGTAGVRCTNVSGAPADSAFSILALKPEAGDRDIAFLWADNPSAVQYTPSSAYAYTPNGPASVQRTGTGRYVATLHGEIGNVQATAYGAPGVSCHPVLWGGGTASVACFGSGGTPADARFTVLAVRGTPASSCRATPAELTAGVYTLRLGNGKSLDAEGGGSFVDGTPLQGWDFHGGANQRWLITPVGGGRYLVRSAAVAKAVDAAFGCYRTAGCRVITWRTSGGPTQLWTIEEVRGMHRLRLADGGMQLGLSGAIDVNGARAQTGTAGCGAHQLWNLARVGDYRLVNRTEGVGR